MFVLNSMVKQGPGDFHLIHRIQPAERKAKSPINTMRGLRRTQQSKKQLNAAVHGLVVATTCCKLAGCEACLGIYMSGWAVMIDCSSNFSGHYSQKVEKKIQKGCPLLT